MLKSSLLEPSRVYTFGRSNASTQGAWSVQNPTTNPNVPTVMSPSRLVLQVRKSVCIYSIQIPSLYCCRKSSKIYGSFLDALRLPTFNLLTSDMAPSMS